MQGHGAKYPCAWCYANAPFIEDAPLRTLGQLRKLQEQFNSEEGGRGDKKYAMEFFNVINMPIIDGDDDEYVLNVLLLDELHLLLGKYFPFKSIVTFIG